MNCEEVERPDDSPDQGASAAVHGTALNGRNAASDSPSPLALVDAVAASALSRTAQARYQAYKEVLLSREQDEAAIVTTLTLFVWDLSESR